MNMHKRIRLTPLDRQEIWRLYGTGNSPLLLAAEDGHLEVVKELLERGANTNIRRQKGRGHSPLEVAAMNGHAEVVKALIDYGADVNSKDSAGYTALMIAAGCGQAETAKALIACGADINAKDRFGRTVWNSALEFNKKESTEVVKTLLASGANKAEDLVDALHMAAGDWSG